MAENETVASKALLDGGAVDAVAELARLGNTPRILDVPDLRKTRVFLPEMSEIKEFEKPEKVMAPVFGTRADFIAFAASDKHTGRLVDCGLHGAILWGLAGDMSPLASAPVLMSVPFARLEKWAEERAWIGQEALWELLSVEFHGCDGAAALAKTIQALKWTTAVDANSTLAETRRSFGQSVDASVIIPGSIEALSKHVTLAVPVYIGDGMEMYAQNVWCALRVDPNRKALAIVPYPGEIELALAAAVAMFATPIRDGLKDAAIPVYV